MRTFRMLLVIGLGALAFIGFVWFLPWLLNPQYFGLRHKSAKYYAELTTACDSMLARNPLGTNEAIKISVTDPSLPKIVKDLSPIKIEVRPQCLWMLLVSDSHAGFGLAWEPQYGHTNLWVLHTIAESKETVIYVASR